MSIPWSKKGNRLHKDWDNTTLGTLDIDGDRLEVQVNSERRARRIEREIAKRLGADHDARPGGAAGEAGNGRRLTARPPGLARR